MQLWSSSKGMLADRNCSNGGDSMNDQMPFLAQLAVDIPECARVSLFQLSLLHLHRAFSYWG